MTHGFFHISEIRKSGIALDHLNAHLLQQLKDHLRTFRLSALECLKDLANGGAKTTVVSCLTEVQRQTGDQTYFAFSNLKQ
jgi:hypothetical protein